MPYKKYFKFIPLVIHVIGVIIFNSMLYHLNEILLKKFDVHKEAVQLLTYNDYQPLKYFFTALLLSILSGMLIAYYFIVINKERVDIGITIISLVGICIEIPLVVQTLYLINNPILQAIIIVFLAISSAVTSFTSD